MANVKLTLTKDQQQYLVLAVLVLGGGGFAFIRYFWNPTSVKIVDTQKKIQEIEGKIQKAQAQAGRLPKIEKELAILNEQAVEAEKRLPKEKDLPAVIDTISALSQRYSVRINSFSPGGQSPKQYFIEVPYTIVMSGSYHDTARFFAAVALEERIFTVRNVTYGAPDSEGKLPVTFTLVSYQYKG